MIEKVLTVDDIEIDVYAKDWEDAIIKSGEILLSRGKIESGYIDSMVNNVKEMGAYIVITDGVAMPHSKHKEFVKETGISLVVLKDTVNFGHSEFDPVKIVVALCCKDDSSHLSFLEDLGQILDDSDTIDKIKQCKTKSEVLNIINDSFSKSMEV